jgi:cytochrome b561
MRVNNLQCTLAVLVVITGIIGLTDHAHVREMLESTIDSHVLLALLLCCLVTSRFVSCVNSRAHEPPELRHVSRELSRLVYLLLYLIIGLRILGCMANCLGHGIAFDLTMIEPPLRTDADTRIFNPHDDFQALLACGLLALAVIRVLALTSHALGGFARMRRRNPLAPPYPRHPWRVSAASSDIDGRFPEH